MARYGLRASGPTLHPPIRQAPSNFNNVFLARGRAPNQNEFVPLQSNRQRIYISGIPITFKPNEVLDMLELRANHLKNQRSTCTTPRESKNPNLGAYCHADIPHSEVDRCLAMSGTRYTPTGTIITIELANLDRQISNEQASPPPRPLPSSKEPPSALITPPPPPPKTDGNKKHTVRIPLPKDTPMTNV